MIEIDSSDGGGQVVRSALALSVLEAEPVRIEGVRGNREDPGLKHQHLAAVEAMRDAANLDVEGAELDSETLTVEPGRPRGGGIEVDVGTAGSVTLVADALVPIATQLSEPLSVTIRGGTDVLWSPPVDAHRLGKLPLLRRHGWAVVLDCTRRGFYPAGGGAVQFQLAPCDPAPLALGERGSVERIAIRSVATPDLADADVAERQADAAAEAVRDAGYEVDRTVVETAAADSTGSAVVLRAACDPGVVCGDALGEQGRPAEDVGETAARALLEALDAPGAVDPLLADQLLVPLAVAGGDLLLPSETDHVRSSLALLEAFDLGVSVERTRDGILVRA